MLEYKWGYRDGRIADWQWPASRPLSAESEQVAFIEGLLRVDHPRASEILGIVGRYHPAKAVAKAARKTAFKRQAIHPS